MAPSLHIFVLCLTVAATCIAEIVTLRSAPPHVQALVERPNNNPPDRHFLPPSTDSTNPDLTSDLDLLDIVLVASVDGKFHALNRTSGHTLWSMSSSPSSTSISAPSSLSPLIRTNHIDHDPDLIDDDTPQELYIIEPQSGDIYVMATPSSPLQRFPFTMSELVDMSPFSFKAEDDHRVFVGRKETSLLLIELETGIVKATLNSECPWDPSEDFDDDDDIDLDELEGSKSSVSTPTEVFIGRTDYHISIYTHPHKRITSSPRVPVQNLSFSTYGPNNQDNHLQRSYRRTKDDAYIQSLPNGEIISFKARTREDSPSTATSHALWGKTFGNPIVAIFDVLRHTKAHAHNPFVLLQPRPRLQDVIPNLTADTATAGNLDPESAYVGMVEETGSLFVMSPARYPLVVFGGSERHIRGRLIDAPIGTELPTAVDAVTKARKYREKTEARERAECNQDIRGDRRCLIGVRKVEDEDGLESRMKRLLDGAPHKDELPSLPQSPGGQPMVGGNDSTDRSRNNVGIDASGTLLPSVGWGRGKDNMWQAIIIAVALGFLSLWFGLKKMKWNAKKGQLDFREKERLAAQDEAMGTVEVPVNVAAIAAPLIEAEFKPTEMDQPPQTRALDSDHINDTAAEDGEDSEADGDVPATPGKRRGRRGKRGKKKKAGVTFENGGEGEKKIQDVDANGHMKEQSDKVLEPSPLSSLVFTSAAKPTVTTPSLVVSDTILGFGSHGTVVFQGSLQGRAVAVKRLLQDFVTLASREVSILQESDDHPNVIRYYYQEAHANFLYIALELCPASLADIIESPDRESWRDIAISFDPKKSLKQITGGLKHLHALKLVHRDIKPQNILVSSTKGGNGKTSYRMLISDFGLCKKLDVDQTSFLPTAHGAMAAGTVGWRAPEILRGEVKLDDIDDNSMSSRGSTGTVTGGSSSSNGKPTRLTKSVDIFALGCLFYYTLTSGGHPFGDRFEREVNILKNSKNLEGLERFGEEGAEAVDLISNMLNPEASQRPDTTTCLLHPFFWDSGRRLNFLQDASDRFEIMCRDPKDPHLLTLEKNAFTIVGNDWHSRLDKIFIENLGKFRKYDGRSVQDLMRALRNKKHHYQDMPDNVKRHLGPMPEGFLSYFTRRYPLLFLHVHSVIASTELRSESMFRAYFELPD